MVKRILWLVVAAAVCTGSVACKKKPNLAEQRAAADAKWRQEQKNKAIKYYSDLVKEYPDSPYAKQAEERLRALGPASPAPKK
jgi:outer membrane protein assembly factor BamD (BamD/ComL family)